MQTSKETKDIGDLLKRHVVIFFLSTLLTGFLAGIGVYESILKIAKLDVVSESRWGQIQEENAELKRKMKDLEQSTQAKLNEAARKMAELSAQVTFYEEYQEFDLRVNQVKVVERDDDTFTIKLEELSPSIHSALITINNTDPHTFKNPGEEYSFQINTNEYHIFFMGVVNDTAKFSIKKSNK